MINVTENESGTDERGGGSTHLEYNPFLFPSLSACSIAEWWWIEVQSPDLAHTTNTTMLRNQHPPTNPPAPKYTAGAERQCNISSHLHKNTEHWPSSDKQSTPSNTVPVSLLALQATWLKGHPVVTDCAQGEPFPSLCVYILYSIWFVYTLPSIQFGMVKRTLQPGQRWLQPANQWQSPVGQKDPSP